MDTPELDTVISEVRALDPVMRERVTVAIAELVEQIRNDATFEDAMHRDPQYRAYVEGALTQSQADVEAGRVRPAEDVFEELIGKHKARHGL